MKKSQAAMEFLVTYGWAILIVLVAIAALTYYGVLDPTVLLPDKCELQSGPIGCVDQNIIIFPSTNGQFHLKFRSLFGTAIRVSSIKISKEGFECTANFSSSPRVIPGSQDGCISFICKGIPGTRKKRGFDMEIKYSTNEGFDKVLNGDIFTAVRKPPLGFSGVMVCPMPPGDGNGDGVVDDKDVSAARDFTVGRTNEDVLDYSAYDFNNDGFISVSDMNTLNDIVSKCGCCDGVNNLDLAKQIKEGKISVNDLYSICYGGCGVRVGLECFDVSYANDVNRYCRCCTPEQKDIIAEGIGARIEAGETVDATMIKDTCWTTCGRPTPTGCITYP